MDRMHGSLEAHSGRINLPTSRLSTKRVLIMSYLEVRDTKIRKCVCRGMTGTFWGFLDPADTASQWDGDGTHNHRCLLPHTC